MSHMTQYTDNQAEAARLEALAARNAEKATYYGNIRAQLQAQIDTGGSERDKCLIDVANYAARCCDEARAEIDQHRSRANQLRSEFGRRKD